jgi:RND family efflux transporter MFP subunit
MKKVIIIIVILLSGVGIFIGLSLLKEAPPEKSEELLRTLMTLPLKKTTITPRVEEYAMVTSLQAITIKAQVSGKVIYCGPGTEDGVLVKKGDVLVEIDKRDYEIAKQTMEAALEILKADSKQMLQNIKDLKDMLTTIKEDYDLEKINYNRKKGLFEKEVYSKNEVEQAMQAMARKKKMYIEAGNALSKQTFLLEATKAKIKQATAKLDQANLNIERASIKSPIDGRIRNCSIELGEYLNIGEKVCSVINDQQPSLKVPVNAADAMKILEVKPDTRYWLKAPGYIKATVQWLRSPESCRWDAKIARIESYNRDTDTISILVVPTEYSGNGNSSFPLLPGMFCRVTFSGAPLKNSFKIPFSALQFDDNVFTVDPEGILHRNKVIPFSVEGDQVIVLSGLPENHSVVVQQLPRGLAEGMKVKGMNIGDEENSK